MQDNVVYGCLPDVVGKHDGNNHSRCRTGSWMKWFGSHSNNGQPWIYRYLNKTVDITTEWAEYTFDLSILDFMTDNTEAAVSSGALETNAPVFLCTTADVADGFELYVDNFSVVEEIASENIRNNYFATEIGDGSKDAPYELSTAEDIVKMNQLFGDNNIGEYARFAYYKLISDIDMAGITGFEGIGIGIEDTRRAFKGTFDGNGHVIKNMTIDTTNTAPRGFFRDINNATIKNLGFENAYVAGFRAGVLAGNDVGNSVIESCFVRNSTIRNNYVWRGKTGAAFIGGLDIDYDTKEMTGEPTIFNNCYSTGMTFYHKGVNGTEPFDNGDVSAKNGGFKGCNHWGDDTNFTVNNCYTTVANFSAYGENDGDGDDSNNGLTVNNSYKAATPETVKASDLGSAFIESKPSYNKGLPVLAWEKDRLDAAPDNDIFSNGMGDGTEDNPYELTTAADIEKMAELFVTDRTYREVHYEMKNDIDLGSLENFQGLGTYNAYYFSGTLNGNGHVFKNMSVDSRLNPEELNGNRPRGLFQALSGATVRNVGFENATVFAFPAATVAGQDIGGSTIEGCFVRDSIIACSNPSWKGYAGGILGQNPSGESKPTIIKDCYTSGLKGDDGAAMNANDGGIMGSQTWTNSTSANMINCYTTHGRLESVGSSADTENINLTTTNCYISATPETVTASQLGSAFIANKTEYNNGLPVLAWEADRLPEVEEPTTYTVSVTVGANGSVTKDGAAVPASFEVEEGASVTLTLVPDAKYVAKAKVNGADYTVTNNQVTLTVAENTTIAVTFERIPDVTPGFAGDNTSYTWFKTEGGVPTIFSYHKLTEFNTGETGLEYGIKLWNNANPENKVTLPAHVSETETAKAVPGAQFAIKVYGDAIKADQNYTIVPYIGDVNGTEVTPDHE